MPIGKDTCQIPIHYHSLSARGISCYLGLVLFLFPILTAVRSGEGDGAKRAQIFTSVLRDCSASDRTLVLDSQHRRNNFGRLKPVVGATWWRSWLRHSAASRKVAGSILDGVIKIFH
jgi:hypothetical protein